MKTFQRRRSKTTLSSRIKGVIVFSWEKVEITLEVSFILQKASSIFSASLKPSVAG